jgi:queuine tRNA-ribosyltransferase
LNLRNARFTDDFTPLDPSCACPACSQFTRAYLAHCFRANEMLGPRLVSLHNIWMMTRLGEAARTAILERRFDTWRETTLAALREPQPEG